MSIHSDFDLGLTIGGAAEDEWLDRRDGMATRVPLAYPAQPEQISTTGRLIQPDETTLIEHGLALTDMDIAALSTLMHDKYLSADTRQRAQNNVAAKIVMARVLRALLAREYPG